MGGKNSKINKRGGMLIRDPRVAVIRLHSILKKDERHYPQVFLKECKYIENKVIRHIHDNLSDFSSDDDESDEKQIKYIRLMIFDVFFEGAIF